MVDRVTLLKSIEPGLKPTGAQQEAIRKALDKALSEAILALPLDCAMALPQSEREDLAIVLQTTLEKAPAEKLLAAWEPKRKLDPDQKALAKRDLLDLLQGKRPPYVPITCTLAEALTEDHDALRRTIKAVAPKGDLKDLLKKWDKLFAPVPATRTDLAMRLLELLDGAEPRQPAVRTNQRATSHAGPVHR